MIGVIADDLTGAAECAALCHGYGLCTALIGAGDLIPDGNEAIVIDTDSRHDDGSAAHLKVTAAVCALRDAGCIRLMKKTDSTLRGNIAVELAACREVLGPGLVLFSPAHPAAGRQVRSGVVSMHGIPVHEGPLARDPTAPIVEGNAITLLRRSGLTARGHSLQQDQEPRYHRSLATAVIEHEVVVADADTSEDITAVCRDFQGRIVLHAGSSALLDVLLGLWGYRTQQLTLTHEPGPWLIVRGSLHPLTLAQSSSACCKVIEFTESSMDLALLSNIRQCWADGSMACLAFGGSAEPAVVCELLARTTARLCAQLPSCHLLVCGGMSARAVVDALGIQALKPMGMPQAGVCYHRLPNHRLLVTKSGGMGGTDCFERIFTCAWA
jgi:D-threonate/D-erythronate kinase